MSEPILVWRFYNAPPEFQVLSTHGGDEDWIAFIPSSCTADLPTWAEPGTPFGVSDVSEHRLPDGSMVLIGAHA